MTLPGTDALPAVTRRDLRDYRRTVDALAAEISDPALSIPEISRVLWRTLRSPEASRVLCHSPVNRRVIAADSLRAFRSQEVVRGSGAAQAAAVRSILLEQIEMAWWGPADGVDSDCQPWDFVDLGEMRRQGRVAFIVPTERRFPQRWRGSGSGRENRPNAVRPELLCMLNEIAAIVTHETGVRRVAVRVAGIGDRGGRAAELDVSGTGPASADDSLRRVLVDYREAGTINLIDGGSSWRVCLSPTGMAHYRNVAIHAGIVPMHAVRSAPGLIGQ